MRLKFTFATFFCFILFVFPEGAFPQTAPSVDAVVNSASFAAGPFAPGEQIDIFGRNFGAGVDFSKSFPLRTNILGVSVSLGGRPLPLFYVDFGQITAQVPYGLAANTTQQLIVQAGNTSSAPFAVTVAAAAPVIFTVNQIGTGQGAIQYADGTLNSASKPAAPGSIVIVYLTGGGETSPAGVEGVPPSGVSHYIQAASATNRRAACQHCVCGTNPGCGGRGAGESYRSCQCGSRIRTDRDHDRRRGQPAGRDDSGQRLGGKHDGDDYEPVGVSESILHGASGDLDRDGRDGRARRRHRNGDLFRRHFDARFDSAERG